MPLRPFQPTPPGCIELVFRFTLFGIPLVIVIWVCLDAGHAPSGTELADVTGAMDNWMTNDMLTELSRDLTYLSITGTDGSTSTGLQTTVSHAGGVPGSIAAASLPSQCAQVVTLLTAKRGRSFRGRTFLPGIPIDALTPDAQTLTAPYGIDVFNAYQAMDARLAARSAKQAVISRVNGGVRRLVCESNIVTGRRQNLTIETVRRRSASAHS